MILDHVRFTQEYINLDPQANKTRFNIFLFHYLRKAVYNTIIKITIVLLTGHDNNDF